MDKHDSRDIHPAEVAFEKSRGRGGGGRRGGKGSDKGSDTQISKALSRLLRHQAENAGIKLDKEGYARLDHVLNWGPLKPIGPSVSDIRRVVQNCEKKRFSLKPDPSLEPRPDEESDDASHFLIRANQGHSLSLESEHMLAAVDSSSIPPTVLHGTFFYFWAAILESGGLKKQGRQHIHCTTGTPEDDVVGIRKDAELTIEIDVAKSMEDGFKWWTSENGYVLTEGNEEGMLPLQYFKEVRGRLRDVGILVKDGEVVGNLPEGIKMHIPAGKGGRGRGGGGKGRGRGRGR
ncbi:hypothetical protein MKZ38_003751 [Zalerion maritima]|uniref:2'-phosphotransferase n=1 Tax=Zalerion maritima TaxID=339359 RepID=A0AAD5RNR7_9PEZI|nr:hypothetical protein MKZ38_003751 [Zalerion maritima]